MAAFASPGFDPVKVLQDLLARAQAGDLDIVSFNHVVQAGQPDMLQIDFIDLSALKRKARHQQQQHIVNLVGSSVSASAALRQAMGLMIDVLPSGKPIEELGVTTEPVVGYRDFLIDGSFDDICLLSRNQTEWPKFKPLVATCVTEDSGVGSALKHHDAPELSCSCGIYAFDTPKHEDMDFECDVWGEIYGWGETYICDSGYRTEFAYPKSIFIRSYGTKIADRVADAVREQYGVPVYIVPTRDGLTEGDVLEQMIQGIGGDTHNDDSTT